MSTTIIVIYFAKIPPSERVEGKINVMGIDKKECSHFSKAKRQDRREEEDKNDKT